MRVRLWEGLAGLVALSLIVVVVGFRYSPPAPRFAPSGSNGSASSSDAPFSAHAAMATFRRIMGSGAPRPTGSAENAKVRRRLLAALREAGLQTEVQRRFACSQRHGHCAIVRNVVARIPGARPETAVLLAAHYDSAPVSPGANDNGASVAAAIEIARLVRDGAPPRNSLVLLLGDGEEAGLLGAHAFMEAHRWAGQVAAVVNLDARGSAGPSMMFETGRRGAGYVSVLARSLERPVANSLFYELYRRMPNDTDFTVFKEAGIGGYNFAYVAGAARYHTPLDSPSNLSLPSLQHQGDSALAMVRALLQARNPRHPAAHEAVFFDLLASSVVWWPANWTGGLTLLATAVYAAALLVLLRRRTISWRQLGWGLLAPVVAWLGAAGLGGLLHVALLTLGALPSPWLAVPLPVLAALLLAGITATALSAALLGGRAGHCGLWIGQGAAWLLLAVAACLVAPGASYLFLVPAVLSSIAALAAPLDGLATNAGESTKNRRPRSRFAGPIARLFTIVVGGLLWVPVCWLLYGGVGLFFPVVYSIVAAITVMSLMPLLVLRRRRRFAVTGGLAAIMVTAGLVALVVPPLSSEVPARTNIDYYHDLDQDSARVVVTNHVAEEFERYHRELPRGKQGLPFPWSMPWERGWIVPVAATRVRAERQPSWSAAAGELPGARSALKQDEASAKADAGGALPPTPGNADHRYVDLRLKTPWDTLALNIVVPWEVTVVLAREQQRTLSPRAKAVAQRPLRARLPPKRFAGDLAVYSFMPPPRHGLVLLMAIPNPNPVEVTLVQRTPGLPAPAEGIRRLRTPLEVPSHYPDSTLLVRRLEL